MAIIVKQNGTDISSSVQSESFQLKTVLTKEVSTFQFNIRTYGSKAVVLVGDQIDVYENGTHIFGGTVVTIEVINEGGRLLTAQISCVDWSFRLNTKLVAKNYAAMDPADIVADIVANFTNGTYNASTYVVRGGFLVSTIKFNYEQVTVSIEKLAKQIGWEWYVDPDKNLHFFPPSLVSTAPFVIDDISGNLNWPTLDITEDLTNMKNSIYVIGGTYTKTFTALTTVDQYLTDGIKTVFSLAYPYDKSTLVVTLGGISQTIGTDQVTPDASVQVQYSDSGRFIRFTSVPTTGQTVLVYGNANIPILAHITNGTAIATYGEQQDVIIDANIKSVGEAQERAQAQIDLYGAPVYTVKFDTLKTGLVIGQTLTVNSVIWGIDIQVIVKELDGVIYDDGTKILYSITAIGTELVNFVDIMKVLILQANSDNSVDDSTVLQVLLSVQETLAAADVLKAPTTKTPPYTWGTSGASDGVWGLATWA